MKPIQRAERAKHFKLIDGLYSPCLASDENSIEINWKQIKSNSILPSKLSIDDMLESLKNSNPTVSKSDVKKFKRFAKDFSQD